MDFDNRYTSLRMALIVVAPLMAVYTSCGEPLATPEALNVYGANCSMYADLSVESESDKAVLLSLIAHCRQCESLQNAADAATDENRREDLLDEYDECHECDEYLTDALALTDAELRADRLEEFGDCSRRIDFNHL